MSKHAVYLLDADPELAGALDPETAAEARLWAVARVDAVDRGDWEPERAHAGAAGDLGLLILDGLAVRDLEVVGRGASEVLGSGDLLRPWEGHDDLVVVKPTVRWTVMAPLRYAILDARFTIVAARWPALMAAVVGRAVRRSRALAFHIALTQVTGIDKRLLLVLWEFAQRWGRVGPEGVTLRLDLTHAMLARLIGARRPSVTTALRSLEERGELRQQDDGRWLLPGPPPQAPL